MFISQKMFGIYLKLDIFSFGYELDLEMKSNTLDYFLIIFLNLNI